MISMYEIKKELDEIGIIYPQNSSSFMQFYCETKQKRTVKFFIDLENDYLELSAYTSGIPLTRNDLLLMNKLNTMVNSPLKILKFGILGDGQRIRIELDMPLRHVVDATIITLFMHLVLNVVDQILDNADVYSNE